MSAAWAVCGAVVPVCVGAPDAKGYPADSPVAQLHLTDHVANILRAVKGQPQLPEPPVPSVPEVNLTGAAAGPGGWGGGGGGGDDQPQAPEQMAPHHSSTQPMVPSIP